MLWDYNICMNKENNDKASILLKQLTQDITNVHIKDINKMFAPKLNLTNVYTCIHKCVIFILSAV